MFQNLGESRKQVEEQSSLIDFVNISMSWSRYRERNFDISFPEYSTLALAAYPQKDTERRASRLTNFWHHPTDALKSSKLARAALHID